MISCIARERLLPVITPDDFPIVLPKASTPALRQFHPVQVNDQVCANASKQINVAMVRNMRRKTFFMSYIGPSYQIFLENSKLSHTIYRGKSIDFFSFYFTTCHLHPLSQINLLKNHPIHPLNFIHQILRHPNGHHLVDYF